MVDESIFETYFFGKKDKKLSICYEHDWTTDKYRQFGT
jgi:hypothetical protein